MMHDLGLCRLKRKETASTKNNRLTIGERNTTMQEKSLTPEDLILANTSAPTEEAVETKDAMPSEPVSEQAPESTPEPKKEDIPSATESEPEKPEPPQTKTQTSEKPKTRRTKHPRYQNEVVLVGLIKKVTAAKNVTAITVCTREVVTVANYPTVMFFGEVAKKAATFKENERVLIKATLQSYDETKLRKGQSPVLTVGLNISYATDKDVKPDTGSDSELPPIETACRQDKNIIDIRGQILAIECNKKGDTTITIRTIVGGRWSIIKYPYYARNLDYFLRNIYVHQYVRGVGTIQTANIPVETAEKEPDQIDIPMARRQPTPARIKTKKMQFYVLFDIYPTT